MNILIDDIRHEDTYGAHDINANKGKFDMILRNAEAAAWYVQNRVDMSGDIIFIDHDMTPFGKEPSPEYEGLTVLRDLFDRSIRRHYPKMFVLVSDNPPGKDAMKHELLSRGYLIAPTNHSVFFRPVDKKEESK